jgi:hypothetical protein
MKAMRELIGRRNHLPRNLLRDARFVDQGAPTTTRSKQLALGTYETDTVSSGYLDVYDQILGPWVHKEIRLLAATAPQILSQLVIMGGGFLPGEAFMDGAAGISR